MSISGTIFCPEFDASSGGKIYIGIFNIENPDPHTAAASAVIDAPGPYSIDMGDSPPEHVIVSAFYDFNNSSDPVDTVPDWPELGDFLDAHGGTLTLGLTDISNFDINIATSYMAPGPLQPYDDFSSASGLFDKDKWLSSSSALE